MTTTLNQNKTKRRQKPFRYVLPINATPGQKRRFRRDIAQLRNPDSQWAVYHDWKQSGEAESYIVIPKSKKNHDKAIYAGIRVEATLSQFNEKLRR